jgi:hypothetical protein
MTFPGSRLVAPAAYDSQPSIANYFLGSNPRNWRTNVPAYSRVRYCNLYPGIDLLFYGTAGRIEFDFSVMAGADPSQIRIAFQGAARIVQQDQGDLAITGAGTELVLHKPNLYQDRQDGRHAVTGNYRLARKAVGFQVGIYDRSLPLVIDPALTYATFFGGASDEIAYAVATDPSGNIYIAGSTSSTNLPTTAGAIATQFGGGNFDSFVAKLSPAGALLYSTYLGGSGDEQAYGLAVDTQGDAYLTGYTTSANFPVTQGAYGRSLSGSPNVFVAKLNPAGTSLLYSSYLGGSGSDTGYGIAVDSLGDMFLTGSTSSTNFPVSAGAYRGAYSGGSSEAFVTALNSAGNGLLYSTYLGGSDQDGAYAIALDARGDAYVAGETLSVDFPNIPGVIQAAENGSYDGFVAALNPSGTALIYSTLLGGTLDDYACGIAVDSSGNAYVTGYTASTNFPHTSGVAQPANAGGYDAFVTKINPSGSALLYSTFLGGSGDDYALPIAVDGGGNAYITGDTTSTDFPVTADAAQSSALGPYAAFVAVLNSDASALRYATYLGGSVSQTGWGIGLNLAHGFIAVGYTASPDFPATANAFQATLAGATNAFVASFSPLTLPVLSIAKTHIGNFTPGQAGETYSVTVSNSAAAGPTNGGVTVTETVPAGLTLASLVGIGWTCPAGGNICTRKDPLNGGSSYPAITVTVNVGQTAANQVTNQVSVAGGGAPGASAQDTATISVPTQTIAFGALADEPFGAAPFTLSASASSGLPVSFTSTTATVCTVSGATVSLVAIGTCTIQATQGGNGNYSAAAAVSQSFTVTAGLAMPGAGSLSFANTIVGKSSALQTVTLQNSGNAALTIASIAPSGADAASYPYTADPVHPCPISPATLSAGATCTLDVAFVPVSQGAHNNAQLAIADNSGNVAGATQTIALAGTGIVLSSLAVSAANASLAYNNTQQFTATGTYSDASTANLTSQVTWGSSAPGVATIGAGGVATAVAPGQTAITATQGAVTSNSFQLTVSPGTPAGISVFNGSGQSAVSGTAFGGLLQALVKDGGGDAVPNASVTFTAPPTGASGLFANSMASYTTTTNSSGIATSLALTANATAGTYSVNAAVTGVTTAASFSLTNLKGPALTITEAPVGAFIQGRSAAYSVTVGNAANAAPTSGTVTVNEVVPAGLTLMGMSGGTTWNCTVPGSCTTNTVLNPGSTYPSIAVTVGVASNAQGSVTNQVSASGGGSAAVNATGPTLVFSACDVDRDGSTSVTDVQEIINEALGMTSVGDDLSGDGVVSVLDVQIAINAVLSLGCSAS